MLRLKLLLISLFTVVSMAGLIAQVNVHGTVTDANGETQADVNILVTAYFADSTVAFQSVYTESDGTYEVEISAPPINMLAILQVSMVDCWGTVTTQEFTIFNSTTEIQADFAYCQQIIFDSCMVYIVEEWNPGALNSLVAWTPVNVPVDYIWSTGETTQYIFPQTSGNYCVTVTFPWGCSAEACYQYVIDTTGFCFSYITSTPNSDGTYNLEIVAQGTAPFTYYWENGQTTSTLNNVGPGTYCASTVDADGCAYTACIFINDPNFCEVWIYDINGGLYAEGYGAKPLTYLWSTGETTQSIIPDSIDMYCVTVTDANQCSASSCFYNGGFQDSCYVFVTVLYTDSNTIALQAIGSSFADSIVYTWNTGETGDIIYPQDPAANYCVTMTDSEGCVATGCFEPYNWCYAWVDLQYVDTTTAVLSVFTDPLYGWGGNNSSLFVWSTGDTGQVITVTESGEYCVTATLGTDCITEACVYVDFENLQFECSAWVIQYPDSNGLWVAEALAWGYGEFSYLWSTGDTTSVIQLSSPDEYVCVTATSTFGCVAEACVDTFFNPCKGYISLTYISNGEVILDAYGWNDPNMNAEYIWSTGQSGQSITVTEEATYCVTITGGGCVSETCVDVTFWNVDSCGAWILEELVPLGTLYTAEAWGVAPFTYLWSNGSTEQSQLLEFNNPQLCVTVTDALGCTAPACSLGGNPGEGISVINGYVVTTDTVGVHGVVYAYDLNSNGGVASLVDSAQIFGNFYKFNPLPAGLYVLKAGLTPGTEGFDEFMPTYHRGSPSWETADPVAVPNWLTVTTDIWMIRIDTTNGPGGIGGVILDPSDIVAGGDVEFRGSAGLPGVTVLLRDIQGNPLNYTITLEDGSFSFTDLPLGTYRISYDIPGLYSPDVWVTLTHDDPEKLQVSIVVTGLVAVDEANSQELELYPNPAKENITIKLPGDRSPYHMQIVDMQGRIVKTGSVQSDNGIMLIDVEQYSPGLYHINLKGENAYYFGRFVKQE